MGTNQSSTFSNPKSLGFTLIELLIVLAIIGVLVGITFSGANYIFKAQREKKALSDVEALKLALEEFKSENGDYPRTDDLSGNMETLPFLTGQRLFQALSSYVDAVGNPYGNPLKRPKSFLKSEALNLGEQEGNQVQEVTMDFTNASTGIPQYFAIDPWNAPYVYDYPRRDENLGYLLFSKGPDGESSDFTKELISPESIDLDNLPVHEPGNW
ncbi:prepilin-type N-terminal cleavage/methylation domain-containing protein [Opitutales bacterium]|jgi:prepilin-type N-terminal cleavage/methylation domain-containing protein|nr:prepilin-type N-terminal cleavage/methylation domain-containing protein [Opitutales bacterium]